MGALAIARRYATAPPEASPDRSGGSQREWQRHQAGQKPHSAQRCVVCKYAHQSSSTRQQATPAVASRLRVIAMWPDTASAM